MSVHYNKQSLLEKHKKQAEITAEQYREITGEVL